MAAITERDYLAVLDCIGRLYDCDTLERFPNVALVELQKLVGAESITFNYLAPSVPKVVAVAMPLLPDQDRRTKRFAQYLPQHAVLTHFLSTGNPGAYKLSDFHSIKEYQALPLYQDFYREIQYEDQMSFFLFPPGSELIGISLARNRRSFKPRDREILDVIRPHLARAFRHVQRLCCSTRALGLGGKAPLAARVTSIPLDARNRPLELGSEARRWINHFFPEGAVSVSQLPRVITQWLKRFPAEPRRASSDQPGRSLVQERDGQRLRLTLFSHAADSPRLLVLGLETIREWAHSQLAGRLTRRETDVLLQVEQGKTNEEVSAALGISPLTVRCHLEHIFEKLHVSSRTAAVTSFRRLCLQRASTLSNSSGQDLTLPIAAS